MPEGTESGSMIAEKEHFKETLGSEKNVDLTINAVSSTDLLPEQIDPKEENALLRKLDRNLLPMLSFMYFLSSLDRSNIANAYTSGMQEALSLTPKQYSNAVSVFYSTYLAAEIPAVLLLKVAKPHLYMSTLVFCWSIITICGAFVTSFGSLAALRVLLGTFEGGFFPAMTLILSMTYKREEQAKRMGWFFVAASLAGAFGGLIATGLTKVKNSSLEGWRWLYIIEGLISVCATLWIYFLLPDNPEDLKFLNAREKELMRIRAIERQQYMGNTDQVSWHDVFSALKDWKTYSSVLIQFCQDTVMYGFSTFLPAILKLGLGFNSMEAQYLTVPVYILAALIVISSSFVSDRLRLRAPIFMAYNLIGIAGYIILLACNNNGVKYFGCYLITFALYTGTCLNISWLTNNVMPHYKRATALGFNQMLGNVAGAVSAQVYHKSPYTFGNSFSLGCICVSLLASAFQLFMLKKYNDEKKAILNGEIVDTRKSREGDAALNFKYSY